MKGLFSAASVILTSQAITFEKIEGSSFRPPEPITVAPWHNYDPNHMTMEEW